MNEHHRIFITVRDYYQTIDLCDKFNFKYKVIGKHGGGRVLKKIYNEIGRYIDIKRFIKENKIDICLTMNSSSMLLAARVSGVYSLNSMDYEFQPLNFFTFRMANKIIVPSYFDTDSKYTNRINKTKFVVYNGFKEQIYLDYYLKDNFDREQFLKKIRVSNKKVIVLVRPSAEGALYHNFNNQMVEVFIKKLIQSNKCDIVLLPRSESQRKYYSKEFKQVVITKEVFSGIDLIRASDLVISAGGTMNREAAVLGIPVYSIFQGKLAGVDKQLIREGRMMHLKHEKEFSKIKLVKKGITTEIVSNNLLKILVDEVESSKRYIHR